MYPNLSEKRSDHQIINQFRIIPYKHLKLWKSSPIELLLLSLRLPASKFCSYLPYASLTLRLDKPFVWITNRLANWPSG